MERLNKAYLEKQEIEYVESPIKILQFGEGNFLRAFVDYLIYKLNHQSDFKGKVAIIQPIEKGMTVNLDEQDGLYTHYIVSETDGKASRIHYINDVIAKTVRPYEDYKDYLKLAHLKEARVIISNTTEAGIAYDEKDVSLWQEIHYSFPAKLTRLLYERYLSEYSDLGYAIVPCELIEENGEKLKLLVIRYANEWQLGDEFIKWLEKRNSFSNTLVDRIVPGFPHNNHMTFTKELNYQDDLMVESEKYLLWVINNSDLLKELLPLQNLDENIIFSNQVSIYRNRKVYILNGLHTTMVSLGLLYGLSNVEQSVKNPKLFKYLNKQLLEDVIPMIPLPEDELISYANIIFDRFRNPYIDHKLNSISLNSLAKFKSRILPILLKNIEKNRIPYYLCFTFASLFALYANGERSDSQYHIFQEIYSKAGDSFSIEEAIMELLSLEELWGSDLTVYPKMCDFVISYFKSIQSNGFKNALDKFIAEHE